MNKMRVTLIILIIELMKTFSMKRNKSIQFSKFNMYQNRLINKNKSRLISETKHLKDTGKRKK